MSDPLIQLFQPALGEDELQALSQIFRSGWIGLGPKTAEFEDRFAASVSAPYAIGVNSGTAALHLACCVVGVGPGDEVLLPAVTFVSTAHAVAYCGAKPVFVDIEPKTLNIDPTDLQRKITRASKAVIAVHYGGHPCRMEEIWNIARPHGLAVIEDAAHAAGSEYRDRPVGGLPGTDLTCFSFQAVKNLAVGDGGMITTSRGEFVPRLRRLRWLGIDKSTWDRTEEIVGGHETGLRRFGSYGWYYEVQELGFKYHMNDITAVIGLVQLDKLDAANHRRREIAEQYAAALQSADWLNCPDEQAGTHSSWHNYVIQTRYRDALNQFLRERRIATGVHYLPLHLQPYYRRQGEAVLPTAESAWTKLLSLPIYPQLTDHELEYVIESVLAFEPDGSDVAGITNRVSSDLV